MEHAERLLAGAEEAVLGCIVSTAEQRAAAKTQAEKSLMESSYAYWEHILWHWACALLAACRRLLGRCMQHLQRARA